jgi:sterol desaturase/sphingolipid hydroxylase (fatty acid hydroxylase superfamily)
VSQLLDALAEPLGYFTDPQRRLHWLYLATALVLAGAVALRDRRRAAVGRPQPSPSLRRILFSRSTALDLQLLFGNSVARAVLLAPLVLTSLAAITEVARALARTFGHPTPSDAPAWAVMAGYTTALFVIDDLTRYLLHRAMHRLGPLWELHKLHHTAEVLTPLTLYRVHPVETALYMLRSALTIGLVTGVGYHLFPNQLGQLEVLGINAFAFAFSALGANLRHSHVWLSFGRRAEHLVVSPAQHQIHHSDDPRHHDRNFGTFLALWDWAGGTLWTTTAEREPLTFGVGAQKHHQDHLLSAWFAPLAAALRPALKSIGRGLNALGGARQRPWRAESEKLAR